MRRAEGVTANIVNNSAVYTDKFITPPLSLIDNHSKYRCQVLIDSRLMMDYIGTGYILLEFIGKQLIPNSIYPLLSM